MEPIPLALEEEVALEGLDGITLETLWFRLSERMNFPLPFTEKFKKTLWNIVMKESEMELFEISQPRLTPTRLDRNLMYSEDASEEMDKVIAASYGIYTYHPVDHPVIRGSCEEFSTRKSVDKNILRDFSLPEIEQFYGNKLVIVASQRIREKYLIPSNIGRDCDINNHIYCILERIGRARYFGEATSGPNSAMTVVNDSKLLHYFRKHLVKNNLVMRQQVQQKIRGKFIQIQLFHLPRFFTIVQVHSTLQAEKLFNFLHERPEYTAPVMEARAFLGINQKAIRALIKSKDNMFENITMNIKDTSNDSIKQEEDEEYQGKKKRKRECKGKLIHAVRLLDPDFDFFSLYTESDEKDDKFEEQAFLNPSKQLFNTSLVWQVVEKIEQSGSIGMSQSEIATYFGLSKLNARAIARKVIGKNDITSYLKDEGRQRTTRFVHKKFKQDKTKLIVEQVAKLVKKAEEATAQQSVIQITQIPQSDHNETPENMEVEDLSLKISIPIDSDIREIVKEMPIEEATECQIDDPYTIEMDDSCLLENIQNVEVKMRFLNALPGVKPSQGLANAIEQGKVSEKYLKRMNEVLDIVKEKTIIDGHHLLLTLRSKEQETSTVKMCRKSMYTLCNQLAADNFLKIIEMELKSPTNVVKKIFIGEPNVTLDVRCWHSIIEEQKIQHFLKPLNEAKPEKIERQFSTLSFVSKQSVRIPDFSAQSVKFVSDFPKFQKYRLFHEFLFYLIYDYPKNYRKIPISEAINVWERENQNIEDLDEISTNITTCFSTDFNWKMFVPPLNTYRDYENGWGLLRDIIHRIPLILYVKFTRYGAYVPDIKEYLDHPIKCNYLIHFLPPTVRDALLQGRKHAAVIADLCKRLCFLGLLQMGPNHLKEVDNTFIYLNRNGTVLNTTETSGDYIQVDKRNYEEYGFFFNSAQILDDYWKQMMHVCINTPIGKTNAPGFKKGFERRDVVKPELRACLAPRTPETVQKYDRGEIPGDHRGAAGLDTWLFSHLRTNWSKEPLPKLIRKRKIIRRDDGIVKRRRLSTDGTKRKRIRNRTGEPKRRYPSKAETLTGIHHCGSSTSLIRKHKKYKKPKPVEDEVDKKALKLVPSGGRCMWSEIEDETLLLIKAALKFVFRSESMIPYYCQSSVIRDILHWRTSKGLDKTTNACKRRILYLMKHKPQCKEKITMYIEELSVTREFVKFSHHFESLFANHKKIKDFRIIIKLHLVELVHRMHQFFLKQFMSNTIRDEKILELPREYENLHNLYIVKNTVFDNGNDYKYKEPENPSEAEIASLSSLLHAGMCCRHDKTNNTFYLYHTYKKYGDRVLSQAMEVLRRLQVASRSALTKTQYNLSNRYALLLGSLHISVDLYDEYLQELKALSSCESTYNLKTANCGIIFMLAEMLQGQKIQLTMEKAERLIMVDPAIQKRVDFEQISDKYIATQSEDQQEEKKKKNVTFPSDSNNDVKFFHMEDPVEIFFKLDDYYLHIFCLLRALSDNESIRRGHWRIDEGACNVKNCIFESQEDIDYQHLAALSYNIVDDILLDREPEENDCLITKGNLETFFDTKIEEFILTSNKNSKQDNGKKVTSLFHNKITTQFLLKLIHNLASEHEQEDGAWLTEYKKVSVANSDENFADDEENDPLVLSSMTNQLKDLNVNVRSSDNFVVNLSKIFIDIAGEKKGETILDGETYDDRLLTFNEEMRSKVLENIKNKHVWLPDDLVRRSVEHEVLGDENLLEICQFLIEKGEIGATASELIEKFLDKKKLQTSMETLERRKFVVRTGINEIRFVHKSCAFKWLLPTFYHTPKTADNEGEVEPPEKRARTEEEGNDELEKYDDRIMNPYHILPAPWIRVGPLNRTINRRCLDKWLGTILNYLSINPGTPLTDLNVKFNVLNAVHLRNLCEILEDIGCIKLMAHEKLEVDIFSEYCEESGDEPATYFDALDQTFVEVTKDAVQRLTGFIGNHHYQTPFV